MTSLKNIYPYLIALLTFVVVALAYFSPVLQGKQILQSDIVQFTGMSKEIQDYRSEYDAEPYWTNSAFGGMPAYQVSAKYPNNFIKYLDETIRFLPRPADYLFLYFVGFFILMLAFKVDWKLAMIGALAFGLTTYYIVILGVGHNAKAHAIGYFSMVLAGVVYTFRKRYVLGFIMTTLASALEIATGHVQMTYYLLFVLLAYGIYELYNAVQAKAFVPFFKSIGVLIVAAVLAVGMNLNHLLPTREYAKESTRSISELQYSPDGTSKDNSTALDKDYITEYSYGTTETFNLFIPRFVGGANAEKLGANSNTYKFLKQKVGVQQAKAFANHAPTYWGTQPIVAAPAYIGAVLVFLFVLALFLLKPIQKWWLLGVLILTLLLSWGKNLNSLTNFFINYVPLYDKFRAVSSIQVVVEWVVPILAVFGLQQLFYNTSIEKNRKQKALLYSGAITGGVALIFVVLGSALFAFESPMDVQYEQMLPGLAEQLVLDRKHLFFTDSLRTLVFVSLAFATLWLYLKKTVKPLPAILALGLLMLVDGFQAAKRYVNQEDFVRAKQVEQPFKMSPVDQAILKDTTHYRVANFAVNPMNDGSTSYFHNSIGGYHAAKPRRYQELFDYQIGKGNFEVLNMLNTKYMMMPNPKGQMQVEQNDKVYGNAWFAYKVEWVHNADEAIQALDSLDRETAVLDVKYQDKIPENLWLQDSIAHIDLVGYKPNHLVYQSYSHLPQLALFSEQYYPYGWTAYIDDKPADIMRANYILRALVIPEGQHKIVFEFKPQVVKKGAKWSLISYIVFGVLALIGLVLLGKKR